mgnify:CR=1 FL=1
MSQPSAAPAIGLPFIELQSVDSTNNYARALIRGEHLPERQGEARHGMAVFAQQQTAGKGQRGKSWEAEKDTGIALSVLLKPGFLGTGQQFQLSATVAVAVQAFFRKYAGDETKIKWPNDLYWQDRKAGGILIENKLMGNNWNWSVVGIGINVNQDSFSKKLVNPVSLSQICGRKFDPPALGKELHRLVCLAIDTTYAKDFKSTLNRYNEHLYLCGKTARLRKGNITFDTTIKRVNEFGQLITQDAVERAFNFGEVELLV